MKFNKGDKVSVADEQFKAMWGEKNVWIVTDARSNVGGFDEVYSCHNLYDSGKVSYLFTDKQLKKI